MRTGTRICYTCVHCELSKDPPKRTARKGMGVCSVRKRIEDLRPYLAEVEIKNRERGRYL